MRIVRVTGLMTGMLLASGMHAAAATCGVPSASHPTIQEAVGDPGCDVVVLAAQVYSEDLLIDRDLVLTGLGSDATFVEGQIEISGGAVALEHFQVVAPPGSADQALQAHSGAVVSGLDLVVVNGAWTSLFSDGFESGDTSAWSVVNP